MNILVTGGAGYVGSHCVRALVAAGHVVVVYDNLIAGHHRAVDPRATLVVGDIGDTNALDKTVVDNNINAVMHFAGSLNVGESVTDPLEYYDNNLAKTVTLLRVMHRRSVKKVVFSSTCATYGVPEAIPIRESELQDPINPYGRTKLAIEWLLRDCALAWSLGVTALRYFNAAGASLDGTIGEDRDNEYHLIPLVLQVALGQRSSIQVYGTDYPTPDGSCVRDYVHVEDLANAHRLAIESQTEGGFRAYNVGAGRGTSVRELIRLARRLTGVDIKSVDSPRRAGDPPELVADTSLIERELGWRAQHSIETVVESAWNWHRTHPNGFG